MLFRSFNVKTTSLSFETLIRLDHTPENTPDFRIEDYARTHPFNYADEELPDLTSCIRRHHQEDTVVEDWLGKFFTGGSYRFTFDDVK